jgi:glycyl-tRNA synthetase alpha chain
MGGIECDPVCAEITYGPERLCLMLNNQFSFWSDLMWNERLSYKDVDYELEMQHNVYNFEVADTDLLFKLFDLYEAESKRVIETKVAWDPARAVLTSAPPQRTDDGSGEPEGQGTEALVYPALDLALKCSHIFNLLDARGAVSPTERANFINRIRARVRACCLAYTAKYKVKTKA